MKNGLVWSDEFEGNALDLTKWDYLCLGNHRGTVNVKEAVWLDGQGHLVITTSKAGNDFHTGMIATAGKFERAFGYFECRVKFQKQLGHLSFFSLMPSKMAQVLAETRTSGVEIGIYEYLANPGDALLHAVRWGDRGKDYKILAQLYEQVGLSHGWHTVGLEWTERDYVFYVDGKQSWRTDKVVSHAPEHIILGTGVANWAGDILYAKYPDSVLLDYIRVYSARPGNLGTL